MRCVLCKLGSSIFKSKKVAPIRTTNNSRRCFLTPFMYYYSLALLIATLLLFLSRGYEWLFAFSTELWAHVMCIDIMHYIRLSGCSRSTNVLLSGIAKSTIPKICTTSAVLGEVCKVKNGLYERSSETRHLKPRLKRKLGGLENITGRCFYFLVFTLRLSLRLVAEGPLSL